MKTNTYIGIIIVAGFILIGYLYNQGARDQIPGLVAAIVVLCKLFQTDAKVDQAAAVSHHNAAAIEVVSHQVAENTATTDTTHRIVNSQRTEMLNELASLRAELATMRETKASEVSSEARIIAAVEKAS